MRAFRRVLPTTLLLFLTCTLSLGAQAEGFYFGVGAYETEVDVDALDDSEYVPAGFVGYQFLDTNFLMLSAELGYYDLGDFNENNVELESSAFTLAGVAYLPIGPFFEIYAKAGVAAVQVEIEVDGNKDDFDDEDFFGGVGFAFDIFDTIDIYAEYLVFDNEVESEMIGIGVRLDLF